MQDLGWECNSGIKYLPRMCKALGSIPNTSTTTTKENIETNLLLLVVELFIDAYDFFNKNMYRIAVLAVGLWFEEHFFAFDNFFSVLNVF
jgi:hypothetical protein